MNPFNNLDIDKDTRRLLYAWVLFAVFSLMVAGVFALLLALARTPVIQDILPHGKDYFRIALVAHVNLSFVIWFLAFMGAIWTVAGSATLGVKSRFPLAGWLGFVLSVTGTGLVAVAALLGLGTPMLVNYVPVLDHPLFHAGLVLFAGGIFITIIDYLLTVLRAIRAKSYKGAFPLVSFAMTIAAAAVLTALVCFALAAVHLNGLPDRSAYFEHLFWGGGHVLQFANTIAMLVAWILLAGHTLKTPLFSIRTAKVFLFIFVPFILAAPVFYLVYDVTGPALRYAFTWLMEAGLGMTTGLFIFAIIRAMVADSRGEEGGVVARLRSLPWTDPGFSSLAFSIVLFVAGGLISIGLYGEGNVKIPSHYHGVIGAVTIAFMGLSYQMLPLLKREIYNASAARIQPYLYGIGQLMFVLGLYMAGFGGVPRKTFGAEQVLGSFVQYGGMGIMGLGGIIAVLGGAAYVVNKLLTLTKKKSAVWQRLPLRADDEPGLETAVIVVALED